MDILSERAQEILKQLTEMYIREGIPVGSKTLAECSLPGLSSATIRKVLGELEERGFLVSPHTSAGRVPTAKGIRFFVDSLLTVRPLADSQLAEVEAQLSPHQTTDKLLAATSSILSEFTNMMSIVMVPKRERVLLRQIEFLPLSDNRILVILVINECEVQNRIIVTQNNYSTDELKQASNFLNQHFAGRELCDARQELLGSMEKDRLRVDWLMQMVVDVASKALIEAPSNRPDYFMAGEANLLKHPMQDYMDDLPKLFRVFNEKRQMIELLDACLCTNGIQIYIGEESGFEGFKEFSMITSSYQIQDQRVGVLGVIGPTRMQYDKIIPIVDITAKLLGTALNKQN